MHATSYLINVHLNQKEMVLWYLGEYKKKFI